MTIDFARKTEQVVEGRIVHIADRPVTFEQFLDMTGEDDDLELINGVIVEKMSAQLPHERLFVWLLFLLNGYVRQRGLGTVLGSRTAVEIDAFGGRIPDLLFVSSEHSDILQNRAIYGAPDLIIEIVSPNDRPSDLHALETDYRSIHVPEIVFIDPQKRRLLILRLRENEYDVETRTEGMFHSASVAGFHVDMADILADPLPDELMLLNRLLDPTSAP